MERLLTRAVQVELTHHFELAVRQLAGPVVVMFAPSDSKRSRATRFSRKVKSPLFIIRRLAMPASIAGSLAGLPEPNSSHHWRRP